MEIVVVDFHERDGEGEASDGAVGFAGSVRVDFVGVALLGRDIRLVATTDGELRADDNGKPTVRNAVRRHLAKSFGDRLDEVRAAMEAAASMMPSEELNRIGLRIYEGFRPDIRVGVGGWGAKGKLVIGRILAAAAGGCSTPITTNTAFQPIVVFDGDGRMIAAVLRPACRPDGRQIVIWLRRLIDALRAQWPRTEIMLRADSHYCTPEVLRFCRARRLDYVLGVAPTTTLHKHILALEKSVTDRLTAAGGGEKLRRFKEFHDGAGSWDRIERIIARVEAGPLGVDTRFIVASFQGGSGRHIYQDIYCARGQAENHIKAWKTHLAADRTSCCRATANQMRLFLHVGAYWLTWSLRTLMPRRSSWRAAQFDTLRLRLLKLAVRVEVLGRQVRLHLPRAMPSQAIMAYALSRLARLTI